MLSAKGKSFSSFTNAAEQPEGQIASAKIFLAGLVSPFLIISDEYVNAMGQEAWVEFVSSIKYTDESNPIVQSNKLVRHCIQNGLIAERLTILKLSLNSASDMGSTASATNLT